MDEIGLVGQLLDEAEPPPLVVARGRRRLAEFAAQPRPRCRPRRRSGAWREHPTVLGAAIAAVTVAVAVAVALADSGTAGRQVRTVPPTSHAALTADILTALGSAADDIIWVHTGDWVSQGLSKTSRWDGWAWPWEPRVGQQVTVHVSYVNVPDTAQEYNTFTEEQPPAGSWAAKSGVSIYGFPDKLVSVDYTTRTWVQRTFTFTRGVGVPVPWVPSVAAIRAKVASGDWSVAGHGDIDGHQAIELRWKDGVGPVYGQAPGTLELWVDATTYLPLEEILNEKGATTQFAVTTYQFLPPTAANLATFNVVIPPGFTQRQLPKSKHSEVVCADMPKNGHCRAVTP